MSAQFLGVGITYYPLLAVTDEHMADLLLRSAEDVAPRLVRHDPAMRETAKAMHRRAPVTGGGVTGGGRSGELSAFLQRCRALG